MFGGDLFLKGLQMVVCRPRKPGEQDESISRQTQLRCMPQPRDTPPKRGTSSQSRWVTGLYFALLKIHHVNYDLGSFFSKRVENLCVLTLNLVSFQMIFS